jgi:hypothetical protein
MPGRGSLVVDKSWISLCLAVLVTDILRTTYLQVKEGISDSPAWFVSLYSLFFCYGSPDPPAPILNNVMDCLNVKDIKEVLS